MKLSSRRLPGLLALVLVLVLMPIAAGAQEARAPWTSGVQVIEPQVNPLYSHLHTPEDFPRAEFTQDLNQLTPMATQAPSMEQAAVQMREAMKTREGTFLINVFYENRDVYSMTLELLDMATCHTGEPTEGDYLKWHWAKWEAQYRASEVEDGYNIQVEYSMTYYTSADQEAQMDLAVSDLLSTLNVSGKSNYEKVCAVYDYICANITYDYDNLDDDDYTLKYSAYAALINKTAVCQGYAQLFYRLMLELDVNARFIGGFGGGGAHGWNIVELDGLYYTVDSTWDAGCSTYDYFLLSTWNFYNHARDLEYETWEFHTAYPMAAEDYTPGVQGQMDPYIYMGICGGDAYWNLMRDGTLILFGSGATDDYSDASNALQYLSPWQYWASGIDTVYVDEGITALGQYNFDQMDHVTTVTLPVGLTAIGTGAFAECASLKSLTFPESLERIDDAALKNCGALTELRFLGDAPAIQANAFAGVTANAYYPVNNTTWTASLRQNYGGSLTWIGEGVHSHQTQEVSGFDATCTEPGQLTYYTCECGKWFADAAASDEITDHASVVIPALGHDYVDGECTRCGERYRYVKFSSYTTSLGGNIAMNFYVDLSDDLLEEDDAVMQFTFAGRTVSVALKQGRLDDKGRYCYSCPITSKNMADPITAQVLVNGQPVGESKTMDVRTYCEWIIANNDNEKTIGLMKAMLNYGASAQLLFDYKTDDLANASLTEAEKVFAAVDASASLHSRTGEEAGITPKSYTLLLDSETTIRVYFELTGDKTIDQFSFTVDGVEVTPKQASDGRWYIECKNIAAHNLDQMHTFTLGGITIRYSGLSYVNQVMTYYTGGTTFDMASALYAYWQAAENYLK